MLSEPPVFSPSAPEAVPDDPPPRSETGTAPLLADGRPRRFDPRHVPCARIGGGILTGILTVAGVLGLVAVGLWGDPEPLVLALLWCALVVLLAAVGLAAWFYPPLELRTCTWRLSPAGLEIRAGVWFRHAISVPRARVQHTDVERGPLERRFGLATLVVHTAGHQDSEIRLDGLAHETALAIRDYLLGAPERERAPEGDGA